MSRFDPSLYLVIGPGDVPSGRLRAVAAAAVAGGVTAVQLRAKTTDQVTIVEYARALVSQLRPLGVPLIVNDDPEAALAAGADGVHVGPFDRPPSEVRRIIGPDAIPDAIGAFVRIAEAKTLARTWPGSRAGSRRACATTPSRARGSRER